MFANADRCELNYPLKGATTVLKEAQDQMVKRLDNLTRDKVKAIFASARFGVMDQRQVDRLRKNGSSAEDAALNEWTDAFMARAAEIRAAKGCRP